MSTLPLVTIAMPCLDEERFIEACVRSVLAQDYPRDRIEVLVADGMSMDATREILARLSAEDPRIQVIDNPDRIQAAGMNHIIRAARGEVVVRMDVHCEYASDYVRKCVEVLERTGADNEGFVDTVFLGSFRRRVFERFGMYDPRAITNEDAELNQRIVEAGGKVYLSPEIVVHYHPRESLRALARQYFKYGKGRARTLLKHKKLLSLRPAIPFFMVTGGAALLATSAVQPLTPFAFGAYALATAAEAVRVGRSAGLASIPVVWAIFPVLHVSHGVGFAAGLVHYGLVDRDWRDAPLHLDPIAATV